MPTPEEKLERRVADLFGYQASVFSGRARSGLLALLAALRLPSAAAVLIPSNVCPDLVLALRSRGYRIRLVPVSSKSGLVPDRSFAEAIGDEERPGVVMPTHLYGFLQEYPETISAARKRGWFILENDTLAVRGAGPKRPRTAFGDALLLSFGHVKTIEAGGGGALLLDDAALAAEVRAILRTYPVFDEEAIRREEEYVLFSRNLRNRRADPKDSLGPVEHEELLFRNAPAAELAFAPSLLPALESALDSLPDLVARRFDRVAIWENALRPFREVFLEPEAEMRVPWRLIRLVPHGRSDIVKALRNGGMDAGTNYPPLTDSFPVLFASQKHSEADRWGREVLNLWLTPAYDEAKISECARIIGQALEKR